MIHMLDQVLDREDLALALILQDPILCMEFLRTTKDGSEDKTLWKKILNIAAIKKILLLIQMKILALLVVDQSVNVK